MGTHHWVVSSAVALSLTVVGIDTAATAVTAIKPKGTVVATYSFGSKETETYELDNTVQVCTELSPDAPNLEDWVSSNPWEGLHIASAYRNILDSYFSNHCVGEVIETPSPYFDKSATRTTIDMSVSVAFRNLATDWSPDNCPSDVYFSSYLTPETYYQEKPLGAVISNHNSFFEYSHSAIKGELWEWEIVLSDTGTAWEANPRERPRLQVGWLICGPDASTPSGIGMELISTELVLPEIRRWGR